MVLTAVVSRAQSSPPAVRGVVIVILDPTNGERENSGMLSTSFRRELGFYTNLFGLVGVSKAPVGLVRRSRR